jgi:hypothetical protein
MGTIVLRLRACRIKKLPFISGFNASKPLFVFGAVGLLSQGINVNNVLPIIIINKLAKYFMVFPIIIHL